MKKISLILLLGISISLTAFSAVKQWEEGQRQQQYQHRADAHTAALIAGFQNIAKQLEDMRYLLEYNINNKKDKPTEPRELLDMFTPILSHEPALIDVDWAVFDPNTGQAHIIYSLKHRNNIEKIPVTLSKHPVTAHITQETPDHYVLQLISPISNQLNPINQPELEGKLVAALVTEWDIKTIIEQALKHTPVAAQDIHIISIENNKKTELYVHASRSRTKADKHVHTDIHYTTTFPFANLTLQAEYEAAPKFLKDFPIVLAWQTLLIWLAATFLLAWYIYKKDKHTEHVEKLVEERTKELNKKRKKLHQIIANLQDIYYEIDLKGNIKMISPSIGSLGYTVDEVLNKSMQTFCIDSDELKNLLLALQGSGDGKIHNRHIRVRHHNGSLRWVSMNAQYRYDENRKVVSIEGTLRDFTVSKAQQEKIQQADKLELLGLMAGSIAHNFNNILTSILGHASMARMSSQSNPKLNQHMDAIESSSTKAAEICKQMLAYTGQGNYCLQPLHLSQCLGEVKAMIRASIPENIQLDFSFTDDLAAIRADKSQIQQLAIDLILNAAESYEQKAGTVRTSTGSQVLKAQDLKLCIESEQSSPGSYIYLRIQDTGCGIAKAMQEKIFEPFITTKFMGRGLGLSAVRGIVRSQHGAILLESEEGKGTTITVFFPVDNHQA
ncbi:two-component system sensor histidine kinase NtrB [Ghiorsea bivora]|uniref:two-component system sensor histidine kinase NtrB n=1 Tax=Ghiorsea bivora TaxID=1485545 RepID=UPI0005706C9A|nr:ATP-binding protein [Ghiorsea bivora]